MAKILGDNVNSNLGSQRHIRILHIISSPHSVGGAELIMAQLAMSQKESGHDVRIVNVFSPGNTALLHAVGDVPYEEIKCNSILEGWRFFKGLRKRVREFVPDVVHVHLFHAGILVGLFPIGGSAEKIWTFHHGNHTQTSRGFVLKTSEKLAARRYRHIVTISPAISNLLNSRFHLKSDSVQLVPNGWSGSPLPRDSSVHDTIVCIAKLREEKDHKTLLHAFSRLISGEVAAKLILVGDGPEYLSLVKLASDLGISDSIEFVGFAENVWEHLAVATLFVLPSRVEPFGIVILEAMAAGVPVVACDTDGPSFLIQNGHNGTLVPIGDIEGMADCLLSLLQNKELRDKYSSAGLTTALLFRSSRMIDDYQALYLKMLTS